MSQQVVDSKKAVKIITETLYIRERIDPQLHDPLYLVLSDLRIALDRHKNDHPINILDYGCGGSPYRPLFPLADYRRADFLETGDLDYILDTEGHVDEGSNAFDLILSTQVLEHMADPSVCLSESLRLLKPGGTFIISSHGSFEDHPCPSDYWRWTAQGMKHSLEKGGFENIDVSKLTTGMRAVIFLFQRFCHANNLPQSSLLSLLLKGSSWAAKVNKRSINRACDRLFCGNRVVNSEVPGHNFYIVLFAVAKKPQKNGH
jgi:SAM-dependent methyltransferase